MHGALIKESGLSEKLSLIIAEIDEVLTKQVNAIIHHPQFQRLEATWRGLYYLVKETHGINRLNIRILDIKAEILAKDLKFALEFDQSQLFKNIYSNEFGHPGGEPYGLIIGDYYVSHRHGVKDSVLDIETLALMSKVSAAAFAPFITAPSPSFFGLDNFSELQPNLNLDRIFQQTEYLSWKKLREDDDSRFVGLVLPRVLSRLPYVYDRDIDQFSFNENIKDFENYLWGSAVYPFAAVVARAYAEGGWFTDIRGVDRDRDSKGIVTGLTRFAYLPDHPRMNLPATETWITGKHEKQLSDLGFISLCECKYTRKAAFYSCQSIQVPKIYDRSVATANSQLSAMLHYILCVSRFAHYLKVIGRDKMGTFKNAQECESYLQQWLLNYVANIDDMSAVNKAKYPLREAKVEVKEQLRNPGSYRCVMQLRPYYQPDKLESSLALVTELPIRQ